MVEQNVVSGSIWSPGGHLDNLTSFIREPEVRRLIDKLLRQPLPDLPVIPKILLAADVDWSEVGYAFQEWLVCVQYSYRNARYARRYVDYRIEEFRYHFSFWIPPMVRRELASLKRSAVFNIRHGEMSSSAILRFCVYMAKLEIGRKVLMYISPIIRGDQVNALKDLTKTAEVRWFENSYVLETPIFDTYGYKGAIRGEGDFLVNDTLWEVKSGQRVNKAELWRQLVGYVALGRTRPVGPYHNWLRLGVERRDSGLSRVRRVGVYLVRAKFCASWPLKAVILPRNLSRLEHYIRRRLGA